MLTFIKIIFIVIAGIFLVSYLDEADLAVFDTNEAGVSEPVPRGTYTSAYDTNSDGTISDREYERGETRRIEEELAVLQRKLAETLSRESPSPFADMASLSEDNTAAHDADDEYVRVKADLINEAPITVTGWTIRSLSSNMVVTIPEGVPPHRRTSGNAARRAIVLEPGQRATIFSGQPDARADLEEETSTFLEDEWIAFLGSRRELWRRERDVIVLFDTEGRVVDYQTH